MPTYNFTYPVVEENSHEAKCNEHKQGHKQDSSQSGEVKLHIEATSQKRRRRQRKLIITSNCTIRYLGICTVDHCQNSACRNPCAQVSWKPNLWRCIWCCKRQSENNDKKSRRRKHKLVETATRAKHCTTEIRCASNVNIHWHDYHTIHTNQVYEPLQERKQEWQSEAMHTQETEQFARTPHPCLTGEEGYCQDNELQSTTNSCKETHCLPCLPTSLYPSDRHALWSSYYLNVVAKLRANQRVSQRKCFATLQVLSKKFSICYSQLAGRGKTGSGNSRLSLQRLAGRTSTRTKSKV